MDKIKKPELCNYDIKKSFLKIQNTCSTCQAKLCIYIEYLSNSHLIIEKARCNSCNVMARVKNHFLQ